jgi:hypothetical protein
MRRGISSFNCEERKSDVIFEKVEANEGQSVTRSHIFLQKACFLFVVPLQQRKLILITRSHDICFQMGLKHQAQGSLQ